MDAPVYRCRLSLYRKAEETYRLSDLALSWTGAARDGAVAFADVRALRLYEAPGLAGVAPGFARCVVWPRRGRAVVLSSNHYLSLGKFEDRSASFRPFVDALVRKVAAVNNTARFISGMPAALWWFWTAILLAVAVVAPLALVVIVVELAAGRGFPTGGIVALFIVLAIFLGLLGYVRQLWRNRPRRFDPRAPGWSGPWRAPS